MNALDIECPLCGAKPGMVCKNPKGGKYQWGPHRARKYKVDGREKPEFMVLRGSRKRFGETPRPFTWVTGDQRETEKPSVSRAEIEKAVKPIIACVGWEGDEDIVTVDGSPTGMTVERRLRVDLGRFMPSVLEIIYNRTIDLLRSLGIEVREK